MPLESGNSHFKLTWEQRTASCYCNISPVFFFNSTQTGMDGGGKGGGGGGWKGCWTHFITVYNFFNTSVELETFRRSKKKKKKDKKGR